MSVQLVVTAAVAAVVGAVALWLSRRGAGLLVRLVRSLSDPARRKLRGEIESVTQVRRAEVDALIHEQRGIRRMVENWIMAHDPVSEHGDLDELRKREEELDSISPRDFGGSFDELRRIQMEAGDAVELEERRQDAIVRFTEERESRRRLVNPSMDSP